MFRATSRNAKQPLTQVLKEILYIYIYIYISALVCVYVYIYIYIYIYTHTHTHTHTQGECDKFPDFFVFKIVIDS